jgi:hypothetical protein
MFSFEKLNRTVGSINKVPLIAEFMVTKWGYEALVVHQFKDNNFEKNFYELEKTARNANYKTVYYIPELDKRLNQCIELSDNKKDPKVKLRFDENLAVVRTAIFKETKKESPEIAFDQLDNLTTEKFTSDIGFSTLDYLTSLKDHYSKINEAADRKRDRIINYLVEKDKDLYEAKRKAYHNESISDLATKAFEKNKILQYKDELVQQFDPVYRDPVPNYFFDIRSHFLAPKKHFMGGLYDTFWFNLSIIWLMTIVLYITLYFESLKKFLELFSKIKLPTLSK